MKNHYNALNLEKNCTAEEIKESYIKLSKKYHPDVNKSEEAQKRILEINEAYSVLKNKSTRHQYDERLQWSNAHQQRQQNFHQYRGGHYYSRPYGQDIYKHYQNRRAAGDAFKFSNSTRQITVVICCCMLMFFGAGIRIMYACSEANRRRRINQVDISNIKMDVGRELKNEKLKEYKKILQRNHDREMRQKKSE